MSDRLEIYADIRSRGKFGGVIIAHKQANSAQQTFAHLVSHALSHLAEVWVMVCFELDHLNGLDGLPLPAWTRSLTRTDSVHRPREGHRRPPGKHRKSAFRERRQEGREDEGGREKNQDGKKNRLPTDTPSCPQVQHLGRVLPGLMCHETS